MAENIMNKLGLFGSNVPGLLDKGVASLYDRDALFDLENQFGSQYGIQNTSSGLASDARHMAAMNNLSNTLSPMNNPVGNFIGDTLAFGAGLINEVPALGRGFDKQNLGEIVEDIKANYAGSFGTPNTTTAQGIYEDVFSRATPQEIATMRGGPFANYGTAQAADLPTNSLERDFPGMSTGDIIDSMNNRGPARAANDLSGLDMDRFAGVSNLGRNDMDVEQVEQLGSPSRFQGFKNLIGSGLGSIRDFAIDKGRMGRNLIGSAGAMALGLPGIVGSGAMTLLSGLGNMFEDRQISGDGTIVDEFGRSYTADELNKQNALGGYYTDAARSSRRRTARIANMLARKAANKKISEKKLRELQAQEAAQEAARQAATTQMAAANRAAGTGGYQAGYGGDFMGGGGRGRGMGAADKGGSDSMGSFRDGGIASMFIRRG